METRLTPLRETPIGDPAEIRRRAGRDGYLFFRGLVDPPAVAALLGRVREQCAARRFSTGDRARAGLLPIPFDDPDFVALQCVVLATPEFAAVGDAPALLGVLGDLYGRPVRTRRGDLCRIAVPGHPDRATPPHQDHHYVGGSPEIWTAWLPLTDCPLELGPLVVLPGSHRGGARPHGVAAAGVEGVAVEDGAVWAGGDLAAGDALLFSSLTIHRSLPNRTADRLRLSVDYRYEPAT